MDTLQRGRPDSSWPAARRCLGIINRLQQGPATKEELITAIYRREHPHVNHDLLLERFDKDKARLQERFGIKICYDKTVKAYVLAEWQRPLLNLPDDNLATLAFLADTFQPDSPHAPAVHQLIERLQSWLPPERQNKVQKIAGQQPTPDLRLRDSQPIPPDVWDTVIEAWQAKQELQFEYLSSQHEDSQPRHHRVQPWQVDFTPRGHWRLRGYCLHNDGPHGPWQPNDYFHYRLSRILSGSAKVLPQKLPPIPPQGRPRQVSFALSPQIARFGISQRHELIDPPNLSRDDNGWTLVQGHTYDVFDLARNLLYYGGHCRVYGGRELLREMKTLVATLTETYREN